MNNNDYTKMTSQQLAEEISKQKEKIKKINETIALLKKLKIAEDFLAKEQNGKSEKQKLETPQPKFQKNTEQQSQQSSQQQHQQQQKPKLNAGGILNGIRR